MNKKKEAIKKAMQDALVANNKKGNIKKAMREYLAQTENKMQMNDGDLYPKIKMNGPTLTFENGLSALEYGLDNSSESKTVLFVMCMQNYFQFNGFRLGHPNYSPNFHEGMTMLAEGTEFSVLDIDTLNGQDNHQITLIYLLNTQNAANHTVKFDDVNMADSYKYLSTDFNIYSK